MSFDTTDLMTDELESPTKRLAACVRLVRPDGAVVARTTFNRALEVPELTWGPVTVPTAIYKRGIKLSNVQSSRNLSVDNFTMTAGIDAEITAAHVEADVWDDSAFTLIVVCHADLSTDMGGILRLRGSVGEVTLDGPKAIFEMRSLSYYLKQEIIEALGPKCRAEFGDVRCGKDLTGNSVDGFPLRVTGTIGVATDRANFTIPAAANWPANRFRLGKVEALAGANAGHQRDIIAYAASTGTFQTRFPFPFAFTSGDSVRATVGCGKSLMADCIPLFNNGPRHRGEDGTSTEETIHETAP